MGAVIIVLLVTCVLLLVGVPRDDRAHRTKPTLQVAAMTRKTKTAAAALDRADVFRPWLLASTVALFVARPLLPSEGTITSSDTLLFILLPLVLAGVWAVRAVMQRGSVARYGAIDLAMVALVAWHGVSAMMAVRTGAPRPAINSAWQWVATATMFWLIRQLVNDRREIRAIAAVMIALAVALSTFGFHQFFYSIPRDQARFAEDPDSALAEAARVRAPGIAAAPALRKAREQQRADGHLCAGELAGRLSGPLADRVIGRWRRGLCVANARSATVATGDRLCGNHPGLFDTHQEPRGDIGQHDRQFLLATWTAAVGSRLSRRIVIALFASVVVVVVTASVVGALDREMLTEAGKSLGYRLQSWQATWAMICDRPWFGCGPGQFQGYYTQYKLPEASETVADPHNFLLEIWATAGTPAARSRCWRLSASLRGRSGKTPA